MSCIRAINVRLPADVRVLSADRRTERLPRPPRRAGQDLSLHDGAWRRSWAVRPARGLAHPATADLAAMQRGRRRAHWRARFRGLPGGGRRRHERSVRRLSESVLIDEPGTPHYLTVSGHRLGLPPAHGQEHRRNAGRYRQDRWPPEEIAAIVASRSRQRAGSTAPPKDWSSSRSWTYGEGGQGNRQKAEPPNFENLENLETPRTPRTDVE